MDKYKKINEVAKLFEIQVSTLHYWEHEKLFSLKRDDTNDYRQFSLSDIFSIWEIMLYRELDISISDIREMLDNDIDSLEQVYITKQKDIQMQIKKLQTKSKQIERQNKLIQEVYRLQREELRISEPDFDECQRDIFDMESIHNALDNPYNCCMVIYGEELKQFERAVISDRSNHEKLIWKKPEGNQQYIECLLKINIDNIEDNNLNEIRRNIQTMGYEPVQVVARYLIIAGNKNERYEYYRAWVEVKLMH